MKRFLIFVLSAVMLTAFFAGCSKKTADWSYIEKRGKIVVGFDPHFPPMGYFESPSETDATKAIGFDIEVAKAIGELLDITVEFKSIDWGQKEMLLKSKVIDLIFNGYTMTEARAENHLFSIPYMKNEQAVVIRTADAATYTTLEDLRTAKICYQKNSSAEDVVKSHEWMKNNTLREVLDYGVALTELAELGPTSFVDCIIMDSVAAQYFIDATDSTKYMMIDGINLGDENYGIGIRQSASLTLYKINNALLELRDNGTLLEIAQKYSLEHALLLK